MGGEQGVELSGKDRKECRGGQHYESPTCAGAWGKSPACRRATLHAAPGLGFTLVLECAPAAARSVGAGGGAGSDDWEDLKRNLGWLKEALNSLPTSTHLASGNLSWTPKGALYVYVPAPNQPHETSQS